MKRRRRAFAAAGELHLHCLVHQAGEVHDGLAFLAAHQAQSGEERRARVRGKRQESLRARQVQVRLRRLTKRSGCVGPPP